MTTKTETFVKGQLKTDLPDIWPGDTIRVYQKVAVQAKDGADKNTDKKRGGKLQIFEGLVIAKKHGKSINSMITIRKEILGVGVEKIFPLHSPNIEKFEIVKRGKVRKAKLYYLRKLKGKKIKLK